MFVVNNTLEDIFLVLYMFNKLSHIATERQQWLFEIIVIVDDVKWNNKIVFQIGCTHLKVLVLEEYLSICKLHLFIKLLRSSDLIFLRFKNAVEAIDVLGRLYLFYLCLGELVDFEKLVDLLVKAVKYPLHLDFTLF